MPTLVIALPDTPDEGAPLAWLMAEAGQPTGLAGSAPLDALPAQLPAAGDVAAVVPASRLSWHRITCPRARDTRLRAALDGLLEEHLLDDPPTLHLALSPQARAGEPAWVAACDKAWLAGWLARLDAAGRPVQRAVPEFAPADAGEPAQAWVTGSADAPVLTLCDAQGVLRQPLAGATCPDDVALRAEPAVAQASERVLGRRATLGTTASRWAAASAGAWNLCQFDLAPRRGGALARWRGGWAQAWRAPAWRPARWGLAVALLVQLAGLNLWAWRERSELAAKAAEVNALLTRQFPNVRTVIDAPLQMEREVALMRQAGGQIAVRDFEPMAAALAAALPPAWRPSKIDYAAGELRVQGPALDAATQDAARQRLAAAGLAARMEGDTLVLRPAEAAR